MTWTYTGNPSDSTKDSVRFLIGDTDTTEQLVTDEEIAFSLLQTDDDIYKASIVIARSIVAKFARLVDTSIDSVRVANSQKVKQYTDLIAQLNLMADSISNSLAGPEITGISQSEMDTVKDNTDRYVPNFEEGIFNNPKNSTNLRPYDT